METKDILLELRRKNGLSQDEVATKVYVTRQAVSRWENGDTIPNTETLKQLSKLFNVSINTLLGSPSKLVCKCCGMPLEDCNTSRENDGFFNEDFCKWCYKDGEYTLDIWKLGKEDKFNEIKQQIINEINSMTYLDGLPKVEDLNILSGEFVNLEYTLPNGEKVKLLDDNQTYLGSQLEGKLGKCYGIAANMEYILICTYEENGENPEIVIYKKR